MPLTDRQMQTARLVRLGYTNKHIAEIPQVHQYLATGSDDMKSLMDGWKREAQDRGE